MDKPPVLSEIQRKTAVFLAENYHPHEDFDSLPDELEENNGTE